MATFIHLCLEADLKRIRRAGLKVQKGRQGVYAMPATPNFYVSHQWARELRRWRPGVLVALYLRISGEMPVFFGHYNGPHTLGTADEAVAALLRGDEKLGFEAIIVGDVPASAIIRVAPLRPVTGWRYFPSAKGREPCGCPACQARGEPFSRRFKDRYESRLN
jgi:hypothetical protein